MSRIMTDGSLHNFWQPEAGLATTEYNESLYEMVNNEPSKNKRC